MPDENFDYTPKPARGRKAKPSVSSPAPSKREAAEATDYTPRPARRREDRGAGKSRLPAQKKGPTSRAPQKIKLGSLVRNRGVMAAAGILTLIVLVVVPVIAELTGGGRTAAPSGSPVDLGNRAYDAALQNWDAGDYAGALTSLQQAASYYEQALVQTPEDAQVRTDLGAVYFYQSRLLSDTVLLQQAIQTWNAALEYEPDKPETLFNMGLGYADLGQVEQAIALWQRVIEVAPDSQAAQSAERLILEYSGAVGP